jgi:hypothetical protein
MIFDTVQRDPETGPRNRRQIDVTWTTQALATEKSAIIE